MLCTFSLQGIESLKKENRQKSSWWVSDAVDPCIENVSAHHQCVWHHRQHLEAVMCVIHVSMCPCTYVGRTALWKYLAPPWEYAGSTHSLLQTPPVYCAVESSSAYDGLHMINNLLAHVTNIFHSFSTTFLSTFPWLARFTGFFYFSRLVIYNCLLYLVFMAHQCVVLCIWWTLAVLENNHWNKIISVNFGCDVCKFVCIASHTTLASVV